MNKLKAEIITIESTENLSLISLKIGAENFTSLIIHENENYIREGNAVYIVFKETEMSLAKNLEGGLSVRNRFKSTISAIKTGTLLAEIKLNFNGEILTAIITLAACKELQLKLGDQVTGLVKTNELMVMKFE